MPGGKRTETPIARRREGKARIRSTAAIKKVSVLPPKYPDSRPTPRPIPIERSAAMIEVAMEILPP